MLCRLSTSALLVGGLVATACFFRPDALSDVGLDFWRLPEYQEALWRERHRERRLNALDQVIRARIDAKHEVAADLIADRITLAQATSRFRSLCLEPLNVLECICPYERGATQQERLCRHVIFWVASRLADHPEAEKQLTLRLEGQLQEYLDHYGTVPQP
jgi:hypothetical protein